MALVTVLMIQRFI